MTARRRSELELFEALAGDGDTAALAELSDRVRRCVLWVLYHRIRGGTELTGEVDEIVDAVLERLEHLRARGFRGGNAEFRSYLYRTVASVCLNTARRR